MPPLWTEYNKQPHNWPTIESMLHNVRSKSKLDEMKLSYLTNNLPIVNRCLLLTYIHTYTLYMDKQGFWHQSFVRNNEKFSSDICYLTFAELPVLFKKNIHLDLISVWENFTYAMQNIQHSSIQYEQHDWVMSSVHIIFPSHAFLPSN